MEKKTVKDHEGKEHAADTAKVGGAAYAPHDREADALAENAGDERTPEKTIGEIKYAKKTDKKQAGGK